MVQVFAYIDPGSSSFLVQAIAAIVLGISLFFKQIKYKIKSIFSKRTEKKEDNKDSY